MAARKKDNLPLPPPESASDRVKAAYYGEHDPIDLVDA